MRERIVLGILVVAAPLLMQAQDATQELQNEWWKLIEQLKAAHKAGNFGKAIELGEQSLKLAEKLGETSLEFTSSLNNLGVLYAQRGDLDQAQRTLERVVAVRERAFGPDHPDTATAWHNLGGLLRERGSYREAASLLERAITVREKSLGDKSPEVVMTLGLLSVVRQNQGNFASARAHLERALAIEESRGPSPNLAYALSNLGSLHLALGEFASALPLFQRAMAIREKELGAGHPELAPLLSNIAELKVAQGDHAGAIPLYERALGIARDRLGPDHPTTSQILSNLATTHQKLQQREIASSLHREALAAKIKSLGETHPTVAVSQLNLAALHMTRAEFGLAIPLLERAVATQERALGVDHPDSLGTAEMLAVARLGTTTTRSAGCAAIKSILERRREAIPRIRSAGSEAYLQAQVGESLFVLGPALACRSKELTDEALLNAVVQLKGRNTEEFRAMLDSARRRGGPDIQRLVTLLGEADALVGLAIGGGLSIERVAAAKQLRDKTYRELLERSVEFQTAARLPSIRELREKLPANGVLVEMIRYEPFAGKPGLLAGPPEYGAFVLTSGNIQWLPLGAAAAIDDAARSFREMLAVPENHVVADELSRSLYRTLVIPILAAAPSNGPIFVVPFGHLLTLPWSALQDEKGKYLSQGKRSLNLLGSSRQLLPAAYPPSKSAVILAAPDFGESSSGSSTGHQPFLPLSGAAVEGSTIQREYLPDARLLVGGDASRSQLMALESPRILHLATHGVYRSGNPSASILALAGANRGPEGSITAAELASLDLRGNSLVVLSACESAGGEATPADGLQGFQRSLSLAGSRSQILSLWKVSDTATTEFMSIFYRSLKSGKSKGESLRIAQRTFQAQGRPPAEWAAFILFGDPGPV